MQGDLDNLQDRALLLVVDRTSGRLHLAAFRLS